MPSSKSNQIQWGKNKEKKSVPANQIHESQEVKYVEVPVTHEKIKHIPKKVVVEVERKVPILEVEWVDREIKVPQIHYVEKVVFQEHVKEVIKQVPEKKVIEVPVEKLREIPRVEKREVVKTVVTQGDEVDVPLPYLLDQKVVVPSYALLPMPTVVAQTLNVHVAESKDQTVDLVLNEFVPRFIENEVFLPRPIDSEKDGHGRQLKPTRVHQSHRPVSVDSVPSTHWNALVKDVNAHITRNTHLEEGASIVHSMQHRAGDRTALLEGLGSFSVQPKRYDWFAPDRHSAIFDRHGALMKGLESRP